MPDRVISFVNRSTEGKGDERIGREYLTCDVYENGDWKLYRSADPHSQLTLIGESWITLTWGEEVVPLSWRIRRLIALNVFQQRKTICSPVREREKGR